MATLSEIVLQVRAAAGRKIIFLPHAVRQMARPERMIRTAEVRAVAERGELVEDYPDDARGHSCLLLGHGDGGRIIHVVCSPKEDYLAVVTAYLPSLEMWEDDCKIRKSL
jgi:hypothetical protein